MRQAGHYASPMLHPRPFYYLENFCTALAWLRQRYGDLLNATESGFMEGFLALPRESAALLARMIGRKGELFRTAKLRYAEIGCPVAAAAPLSAHGWVDCQPVLTFAEVGRMLRKAELCAAFRVDGVARGARGARKGELIESLTVTCTEARPLTDWWPEAPDAVYRLAIKPLCERLRLLFFGNFRQDWSEFVLTDLGIFKYEKVVCDTETRAFQTRAHIDAFETLFLCRQRLAEEGSDLEAILASLPNPITDNEWLENRRSKLQLHLLERLRVKSGVKLPRSRRPPPDWVTFQLVLPTPERPARLEQATAEALSQPDAPVYYVENGLLNSLFGLWCWEAIFAPVAGAFFHEFQAAPADLHTPGFQARRAELFAKCFQQLDSDAYRDVITSNFAAKQDIQSPFVFWGVISQSLLTLALDCLPREHLRACFERILADIRAHRSGLPDLVQFWPAERRYRLIEVKGPGDRLQDNQVRWLRFCVAHAIPVSVCHVSW